MCAEPRSTNINLLEALSQISALSHSQAAPVTSRGCHVPAAPRTRPAPSVPAPACAGQGRVPGQRQGPASAPAPGGGRGQRPRGDNCVPSLHFLPSCLGGSLIRNSRNADGLGNRPHMCVHTCAHTCMGFHDSICLQRTSLQSLRRGVNCTIFLKQVGIGVKSPHNIGDL